MGQRHQIYVIVENPITRLNLFSKEDKAKAKKLFGTNETTVFAFHHQWLYGGSALVVAKHILDITDKKTIGNSNPFSKEFYGMGLSDFVEKLTMMVSVISNPILPRGIGIESMCLLNEESSEYIEDFTIGDNNDGITIIDTIERKYCFMNIYEQEVGRGTSAYVGRLPKLIPSSASQYYKAYYPSGKALNKAKILGLFKNEVVLTLDEVKARFPKVYENELVS